MAILDKIGEISKDMAIDIIQDYPNLERRIEQRKQEIEAPYHAHIDENIGGGRPQNVRNESIEKTIELKDEDRELAIYYWQRDAVRSVLRQCVNKQVRSLLDRATYDIIYEFHFRESRFYNADGIARKVGLSRSSVYNRENAFIEAVRKKLNETVQKLDKTH